MNWQDLGKELVNRGLPALGAALGGPAGAQIGSWLASAFGAKADDPKDILNKIALDPQSQIKLLQMQQDYQLKLIQLENEDSDSARKREEEIAKAGKRDYTPEILALSFVIIYAIIQLYAIYNPGTQDDVISARVQDIVMMIIGYYFGSSKSSRIKDEALAQSIGSK